MVQSDRKGGKKRKKRNFLLALLKQVKSKNWSKWSADLLVWLIVKLLVIECSVALIRIRQRPDRKDEIELEVSHCLSCKNDCFWKACVIPVLSYYLDKKKNHHRDSRREERCSTCDIMLDQARSAQGKSDPRLSATLPCADRAWSSMISHVEQRYSRRESRWSFFFFFVQGSTSWKWLLRVVVDDYLPDDRRGRVFEDSVSQKRKLH